MSTGSPWVDFDPCQRSTRPGWADACASVSVLTSKQTGLYSGNSKSESSTSQKPSQRYHQQSVGEAPSVSDRRARLLPRPFLGLSLTFNILPKNI